MVSSGTDLYAGTFKGGIFRSSDTEPWTEVDEGLPNRSAVKAMVMKRRYWIELEGAAWKSAARNQ